MGAAAAWICADPSRTSTWYACHILPAWGPRALQPGSTSCEAQAIGCHRHVYACICKHFAPPYMQACDASPLPQGRHAKTVCMQHETDDASVCQDARPATADGPKPEAPAPLPIGTPRPPSLLKQIANSAKGPAVKGDLARAVGNLVREVRSAVLSQGFSGCPCILVPDGYSCTQARGVETRLHIVRPHCGSTVWMTACICIWHLAQDRNDSLLQQHNSISTAASRLLTQLASAAVLRPSQHSCRRVRAAASLCKAAGRAGFRGRQPARLPGVSAQPHRCSP